MNSTSAAQAGTSTDHEAPFTPQHPAAPAPPPPAAPRKKYKGVSEYRNSGRYEAHVWISSDRLAKCQNATGARSTKAGGKQLHLGSYADPVRGATAHDIATIYSKGFDGAVDLNFPKAIYEKDARVHELLTKYDQDVEGFVTALRGDLRETDVVLPPKKANAKGKGTRGGGGSTTSKGKAGGLGVVGGVEKAAGGSKVFVSAVNNSMLRANGGQGGAGAGTGGAGGGGPFAASPYPAVSGGAASSAIMDPLGALAPAAALTPPPSAREDSSPLIFGATATAGEFGGASGGGHSSAFVPYSGAYIPSRASYPSLTYLQTQPPPIMGNYSQGTAGGGSQAPPSQGLAIGLPSQPYPLRFGPGHVPVQHCHPLQGLPTSLQGAQCQGPSLSGAALSGLRLGSPLGLPFALDAREEADLALGLLDPLGGAGDSSGPEDGHA